MLSLSSKMILLLSLVFFLLPPPVQAHLNPFSVIKTELNAKDKTVNFRTEFPMATDIQGAETASKEEKMQFIKSYYDDYFAILYGKTPQQSVPCRLEAITDYLTDLENKRTVITGVYACPEEVVHADQVFVVTDSFSDVFVTYDHYLGLRVGNQTKDFVLNQAILTNFTLDEKIIQAIFPQREPNHIVLSVFRDAQLRQPQRPLVHVLKRFMVLGVEHILTGYDHVLFLFSAILLVVSLRHMLILVTSFTVAHSITLVLAGLGYLRLSASIVEPLIAASIVWVAVRNLVLLKRGNTQRGILLRERWILAFGFGLFHGLGFAGVLADVEIPSRYFVPALLTFNAGVEVGQLAMLLFVVPLLKFLEFKCSRYRTPLLFVFSGIISAVALYWFLERLGLFLS